jgi:hypothetical protein
MVRKIIVALAAIGLLTAGGLVGMAYSQVGIESHDTALRANAAKKLMVMTQDDPLTISNTTLASFTSDTIAVPAKGNYRAVVRFSGESACSATSWCTLVIFVDGVEASPKSGSDFAFDSSGGEIWQSLSVDRTSDVIAGTGAVRNVVVDVQVAAIGGGSWRLDDWSVVTELFKV